MKSIILKKWIEPYKLLETIKEYYSYKDFTFDGITKSIEKKKFFNELLAKSNTVGLYMKNVNKYYLFSKPEFFDIWSKLANDFEIGDEDFDVSDEFEIKPFEMVDMGKAEAILLLND